VIPTEIFFIVASKRSAVAVMRTPVFGLSQNDHFIEITA
jgi:hypothetical protein